jgi:hypothetical protein
MRTVCVRLGVSSMRVAQVILRKDGVGVEDENVTADSLRE